MTERSATAWRAHLVTRGKRSALLLASDASPEAESALLEELARDLVARVGQRADVAVRSVKVSSKQLGASELAEELRADYAVRLSAESAGERVTVVFTAAPTSRELPAHRERFEGPAAERLRFADETAAHVLEDLLALLDEETLRGMREWGTKNVHAYRLAREAHELRGLGGTDFERFTDLLTRAIGEDPQFGWAYRRLAMQYSFNATVQGTGNRERMRKTLDALLRTGRQAGIDAETLSRVEQEYDELSRPTERDDEESTRARILRNPDDALALRRYAELLAGAGLVDEAERYHARLLALVPDERELIEAELPNFATARGDLVEAIRLAKQVLERFPAMTFSLYGLVLMNAWLGRYAEAGVYLNRFRAADRAGNWAYSAQLHLMAFRGEIPLGSAALEEALADRRAGNLARALVLFALGDVERGCRLLREMSPGMTKMLGDFHSCTEYYFKRGVVSDPRYQDALDALGIGQRWKLQLWQGARALTPVTGIPVTSPRPERPTPLARAGGAVSPEEAGRASRAALNLVPYAVFALDASGDVVSTNAAAQRLLKGRESALRLAGARLVCADPSAARALKEAVERAVSTHDAAVPALVSCRRHVPAAALQLLVSRIAADLRHPADDAGRAVALVVVADPNAAPVPAADALQQLFDLTPALSRLASAIAAGKTVAEYAADHEVSENTARQYLKELMARVGVRRQAELVRVLLSGVAQLRTPEQAG